MKPKLVIGTDNYLPRHDGVVRFLSEIIPRLTSEFNVTLICPHDAHIPPLPDVELVTIPVSKRKIGDFTFPRFRPRKIAAALKGAKLVFTQTLGPIGGTTLFLAKRKQIPSVAYIHSLEWELAFQAAAPNIFKKYVPYFARRLARYLYSSARLLFIPSDGIAEQFTWEKIHTPRKIVRLGVNTKQFIPVTGSQRKEIREKLGFGEEDVVIGYHGRLAREKDISSLIRAYVKLRKRNKNLRVLLIGNGVPSLEKKFKKQPGVTVYPAVADVERYLPAMDIYCLTSLTETTSLAVLEAMSCELPVVATPVGFVKDYVDEGETGLLTKKKDSFHIAKQLNIFIKDPVLRKKIGKRARQMVEEKFNWDTTAKNITKELKDLL